MDKIINSFITIFIAIDPIGIIPFFISYGTTNKQRVKNSVVVATIAGIFFLILGRSIFSIVGITVKDIEVAGGTLLIAISIKELLFDKPQIQLDEEDFSIVPLAVPLIVGPATITALFVSSDIYGYAPTVISYLANLILTYFILLSSEKITTIIGERGVKVISKLNLIILAAFGVSFIRRGVNLP